MKGSRFLPRAAALAIAALLVASACSDPPAEPEGPANIEMAPSFSTSITPGSPVAGAVYTSTRDRSIVNANHYDAKEDVYLNGGPSDPDNPKDAALLRPGPGWYFYQVTDPSGKDLLSSDPVWCRLVYVDGRFVDVPDNADEMRAALEDALGLNPGDVSPGEAGGSFTKSGNSWSYDPNGDCSHDFGGPFAAGDIAVQLYPYDNTPNKGGVYKAWVTPVVDYTCDIFYADDLDGAPATGPNAAAINAENCGAQWHGFVGSQVKTDNYKVKGGQVPPEITILKFHDADMDGVKDETESYVEGWQVDVTDPLGITTPEFTSATVLAAEPGTYTLTEEIRDGTLQTVGILDGATVSLYPTADPTVLVPVAGDNRETHEVVFGNVGLGEVNACKIFDRDGDGEVDPGEPGVEGWQFTLEGYDVTGAYYSEIGYTDATGCTTFDDLLPGTYTVTEGTPAELNWYATGDLSVEVTITSSLVGSDLLGTVATVEFTNICFGEADFDTKGYWHNKNGLVEITAADIAYVNGLAPYANASSYFDDGDEPFDGYFSDGTCVDAAIGDGVWQGVEVAPTCSPKAEISQFLVDRNATGDPREQLAQQLLAFILNTRHRLDGPNAVIELPGGSLIAAGDLITAAIDAWSSGTAADQNNYAGLLDSLNNNDAVPYIPDSACPVSF